MVASAEVVETLLMASNSRPQDYHYMGDQNAQAKLCKCILKNPLLINICHFLGH